MYFTRYVQHIQKQREKREKDRHKNKEKEREKKKYKQTKKEKEKSKERIIYTYFKHFIKWYTLNINTIFFLFEIYKKMKKRDVRVS